MSVQYKILYNVFMTEINDYDLFICNKSICHVSTI